MKSMDNLRERFEALKQQPEHFQHQTHTLQAQTRLVDRRRWWRITWRVMAVIALGLTLVPPPRAHAETFACGAGAVDCLITAIKTANANGEDNTITLEAGTYTLTTIDNDTDGANGLPSVTSTLTIQGAEAATTIIERESGAPLFRLVHIAADGILTLEGLTLQGGRGSQGGGIYNDGGTVRIINSIVTNNGVSAHVVALGGGVYTNGGVVTILNSTLADNSAIAHLGQAGGGLYNNGGTVRITNSTLTRNTALSTDGNVPTFGAGLFNNNGMMTLTDSAVTQNTGGGISNGSGSVLLINSTVAGNTVGGIDNSSGTVTLTNSTIAGNSTRFDSGGINNSSGTVTLLNTILTLNTTSSSGPNCSGAITSLGTNLLGDLTDCTLPLLPTDLTGDPGLGSFTDDGIPGHGHFPLLPDSPAIDAGNDAACPPTDQLGQPRVGRHCDIGAIEFQSTETTPPTITITATPETLWPPNGKLVPVIISGTITDAGSGVAPGTAAYAVTDEYGLIQPSGPVTVAADSRYAVTVKLQASRNGTDRDGRQYTITVSAQDNAGNMGSASIVVTVPHDQGH